MGNAFDHIASDYDSTFTDTTIGKAQRAIVFRFLDDLLAQQKEWSILELNCGTGADAITLAQRGYQVHATDVSTGMLKTAEQKAQAQALDRLTFGQLDAGQMEHFDAKTQYDLIFSNFGGLNCVSRDALTSQAKAFADRLKPGGHFVAVVMSEDCRWERLYFNLKLDPKAAKRRSREEGVAAQVGKDTIHTWYYSPTKFAGFFASHFEERQRIPVGFWLPPSYLEPRFENRPKLLARLAKKEALAYNKGHLAEKSDHYLIHLQKK